MGKNNQQRRAAKRRARAAAQRGQARTGASPSPDRPAGGGRPEDQLFPDEPVLEEGLGSAHQAAELLMAAVQAVGDAPALDDAVRDLVVFDGAQSGDDVPLTSRAATEFLMDRVGLAYEHGWQPADLVHVVRRDLGARPARLIAAVIIRQALAQRAAMRAPREWVDQLDAVGDAPLADTTVDPSWNVLTHLRFRMSVWDGWHDIVSLIAHLFDIARMPRLGPPPSTWGSHRPAPAAPRHQAGHDPKKLLTIRALLAKAEATQYALEADAFTAKAQDLMTRYAIDEAMLADETNDVEIRSRRVHVDNPYASTKAALLDTVGKVNRVKAIWDERHGIATIVGLPVDLDLAEMLFTSLLVQATRAMTEAGASSRGGHRLDRAPSFRRAFLLSYAHRIGERLAEAGGHAQQEESEQRGRNLLPVLARQTAAVETEFVRLFPHITQSRAVRVDARGWDAGRVAADRAVLARGQVDGRSA